MVFAFGMTAAFLIYLWVVDELTFEDFQVNKNETSDPDDRWQYLDRKP